ncbi:MAG: hypothetical protein GY862_38000 [Gammaproteobacteria bacterium]|nr:hypothetical protein [Gammaproteobacteria bacterium]
MPNKTSISKAATYQETGEFWDEHDATEFGEQTNVEFTVDIQSQHRYYLIDSLLSLRIRELAQERGISRESLLNSWVKEKVNQIENKQPA